MVAKQLYSMRMEPKLLEALRDKADIEQIPVSQLIHNLLLEGLGLKEGSESRYTEQELKNMMDTLKEDIKKEIRHEIFAARANNPESGLER